MIVKTLLIAAVTALHLAVVPRSARADQLVLDSIFSAEFIEYVYSFCSGEIRKFRVVICLEQLWSITEICNRTLYEAYG